MCRIVANNHNLTHFLSWIVRLSQNGIFQILNQKCFLQWPWFHCMVRCEGFRHNVKYRGSNLKFCFFSLKQRKWYFSRWQWQQLVKIHQQNAFSVLNTIIHLKKVTHVKKCSFILIFFKNRSFCQSYPQIFTLIQLWW